MAINSSGYDGWFFEADQVQMAPKYGADYYVEDPGHFAASPADGARALSISAGFAGGRGVRDRLTEAATLYFDPVPAGSRWDLVVLRRDWQPMDGGPSSLQIVKGTSAKSIPGGRKNTPGTEDDQPLWLVRLDAGSTGIGSLEDLRCFYANGNLIAKSDLSRQYLGIPGTRVQIGSIEWVCNLDTNNLPVWEDRDSPYRAKLDNATSSSLAGNENDLVQRDSGGYFGVKTPTIASHPTTKAYVDDGLAKKPTAIMRFGTVSVPVSSTAGSSGFHKGTININLPAGVFDSTPVVYVSALTEYPELIGAVTAHDRTKAGFLISVTRKSGTATTVSWIALAD